MRCSLLLYLVVSFFFGCLGMPHLCLTNFARPLSTGYFIATTAGRNWHCDKKSDQPGENLVQRSNAGMISI